jgi:hypothetical protein
MITWNERGELNHDVPDPPDDWMSYQFAAQAAADTAPVAAAQPRKRGRPSKITPAAASSAASADTLSSMSQEAHMPKKRGRPRKDAGPQSTAAPAPGPKASSTAVDSTAASNERQQRIKDTCLFYPVVSRMLHGFGDCETPDPAAVAAVEAYALAYAKRVLVAAGLALRHGSEGAPATKALATAGKLLPVEGGGMRHRLRVGVSTWAHVRSLLCLVSRCKTNSYCSYCPKTRPYTFVGAFSAWKLRYADEYRYHNCMTCTHDVGRTGTA